MWDVLCWVYNAGFYKGMELAIVWGPFEKIYIPDSPNPAGVLKISTHTVNPRIRTLYGVRILRFGYPKF